MQTKKSDIRKVILEVSKKEFLEHGFKDASMRTIARKAGVGLSNIYNYFKNKDEILQAVLQPLMNYLNKIKTEHNNAECISLDMFYIDEYQRNNIQILVDMVEQFRNELNLLLFHVHGSKLENYKEELINDHTRLGLEYLQKMKEKYPNTNSNISEFFIHNSSSWWINILSEIVMHNLTHNEVKQFISEYVKYSTAGWKKLMQI